MAKKQTAKKTAAERGQERRAKNATPPIGQHAPGFVRGARLSYPDDESPEEQFPDFSDVSDVKKRTYLRALCRSPRWSYAAKKAGVSTVTGWNWRNDLGDGPFQRGLAVAWKIGLERAESEMWRRGIHGFEEPVYNQGRLVGTKLVHDTTAAIFMLKGAMPDKYRERFDAHVSGSVQHEHAHLHLHGALPAEELARRLQQFAGVVAVPGVAHDQPIDVTPQVPALPAAPEEALTPEQAYERRVLQRRGNGNGHKP